ncbi:unnamed protein product [Cylicocyclus nassatus]|uniref:J domain-containing protein n=1 Tax=Cylicocyclus nassatus TaxID=53992 RepID=A0AA36GNI8_CYLNA|nr:unnamed protein product [Cylicocyclus nassatus]
MMYRGRLRSCSLSHWSLLDCAHSLRCHLNLQQTCRASSYEHPRRKRNYYEVLGVRKDATQKEIKAAFYAKSKQLHPDNKGNGDSTAEFVELKEAYDNLRRPADRRAYDMGGHDTHSQNTTDPYTHRHYYQYYHQRDHDREWARYWGAKPGAAGNASDSPFQSRSQQEWGFILKWSAFAITLVVLYNVGYLIQLRNQERRLSKLIDEQEIAKSFMRQREFRDKDLDNVEMYELARKLKGDIDEAWKRKVEDMAGKNPNEIREEYRWLRAVQDRSHNRRVRARRAEQLRKDQEAERSSTKVPDDE